MMISCPEEIAFRLGYIDQDHLRELAAPMDGNRYGRYLLHLAKDQVPELGS